ncbi:MAG: response regulator [Actinobacteria bacterium]|nr:response regulator [Actinomycetota bacterium]MCB9388898.1 response regulator [Acidimicrobiia bacterium]
MSQSPVRVVIAEDEAIIRLDLKELLEEEGYEVVGETGRGDEVLRLVQREQPDVAILDINMPGMNGLEAARQLTDARLCAVLILTAFSQRELVDQARAAGALAFLVKPFQKSDLVPAIEVALSRFSDMQNLRRDVEELNQRLDARKVVDRAKGTLMEQFSISENDAWRLLQTEAMRQRVRMSDVAAAVLDGSVALTP